MTDERIVKSPDTKRISRMPPGRRATWKWPVLHHRFVPDSDTSSWTFAISGLAGGEVYSAGGFTADLPPDDFFGEDVLFSGKHEGEELAQEHGSPVGLVVPRLHFWQSAEWDVGIEFVHEDGPGLWESAGCHHHGDPWKEERYRK